MPWVCRSPVSELDSRTPPGIVAGGKDADVGVAHETTPSTFWASIWSSALVPVASPGIGALKNASAPRGSTR